jgi:hypothetical protein
MEERLRLLEEAGSIDMTPRPGKPGGPIVIVGASKPPAKPTTKSKAAAKRKK